MLTCNIANEVLAMFPAAAVMAFGVDGMQGMATELVDFAAAPRFESA